MRSTDLKEKHMLAEWVKYHMQDDFWGQEDTESYFIDRCGKKTYMMEYDFSTITELEHLMERVSEGRIPAEVRHMLSVAAFKAKPIKTDKQKVTENEREMIPEFIYVF